MPFAPVQSLRLIGVWDAGVPNRERVALRVLRRCDLENYALITGLRTNDGFVPEDSGAYWFDAMLVEPGTWVIVYTGRGQTRHSTMRGSGAPAIVLHWGATQTLFGPPLRRPALVHINRMST